MHLYCRLEEVFSKVFQHEWNINVLGFFQVSLNIIISYNRSSDRFLAEKLRIMNKII